MKLGKDVNELNFSGIGKTWASFQEVGNVPRV